MKSPIKKKRVDYSTSKKVMFLTKSNRGAPAKATVAIEDLINNNKNTEEE